MNIIRKCDPNVKDRAQCLLSETCNYYVCNSGEKGIVFAKNNFVFYSSSNQAGYFFNSLKLYFWGGIT